VVGSDGHIYDAHDNLGHVMDGAKIIESGDPADPLLAVYHHWDDASHEFRSNVATSSNLLDWTWRAELGRAASQPTIRAASDGGFVVAWEQEPDNHMNFAYYPELADLLSGRPTKTYEPPRQLSTCAEGTPSLYAASSTALDVGFHYFRGCELDRQARGTTDWTSWTSSAQPDLDAAMEAHGVEGGIGDRDGPVTFDGREFMMFEGMRQPDHWETFRVFLYDTAIGESLQLGLHTHGGSVAFTNPTINTVTLDGMPTLVMALFVPQEGARANEAGELIYYRLLP
jgi:hypothetical protein